MSSLGLGASAKDIGSALIPALAVINFLLISRSYLRSLPEDPAMSPMIRTCFSILRTTLSRTTFYTLSLNRIS